MTELYEKDEKAKQIRERSEARIAKDKLVQQSRPIDTGSSAIGKYLKKDLKQKKNRLKDQVVKPRKKLLEVLISVHGKDRMLLTIRNS